MGLFGFEHDWIFFLEQSLFGIFLLILYIFVNKNFIRSNVWFVLFPLFVFRFISSFFQLYDLVSLFDYFLVALIIVLAFLNEGKIKKMIKKNKKREYFKKTSQEEKAELYKEIRDLIVSLSKKKIGALITFEKKDLLVEYLELGVRVDAKVSKQLLETIFFPNTPLHDGAVIIRGDYIEAASVYYTPTTKPMKGSYGARHRAALGISEVSDALTIVVSEETGKISLTYLGELIPVKRDEFLYNFKDFLEQSL